MTRYLLYSHDTYGLGHLRRSTLLAEGIVAADPTAEVVIATGSPRSQAFPLPERVDTVKLPAVTKADDGSYEPRKLLCSMPELVSLRAALLASTAASYRPDVVVVDHAPAGLDGELLPMLDMVEAAIPRPRLVLGLRDVIDEASKVEQTFTRDNTWAHLARYDEIVVYGDATVLTTATELDLESRIGRPVHHVGYVAPAMPERASGYSPFVLVAAGGGGDGQALIRATLDAVEAGAMGGLRTVVVTGPLLSAGRRAELFLRAERCPDVELMDFCSNMRSLIASATGVISMAGYNTVVEELAAGVPSLLVPRTAPRLEQDIRARRLSRATALQRCPLAALTPNRVRSFVDGCLATGGVAHPSSLDLSGVATLADHLGALVGGAVCA